MRNKSALFTPGELTVRRDASELTRVTKALRGVGRRVALVPTMGALHDGHLEIVRRARRIPGTTVVVSIFVNPLQFGPNEDFDRYPRSFDADVQRCATAGVELVFAPGVEQIYPNGTNQVTVHPGPLGDELDGASRPGHFAGVLTVVAKLLHIVNPDYAFFGEKDYQQLVLLRRMARELNFPTRIIGVPTVRESDGLALSSRNVYLTDKQRLAARSLSMALTAGASVSAKGPSAVLVAANEVLAAQDGVALDYLQLRDPDLGPAPDAGNARLLVAAQVGNTRLIDNIAVLLGTPVQEG